MSLLGEYCSKRKLGAPVYELCFECGPDHRKNFLFKVYNSLLFICIFMLSIYLSILLTYYILG